MTKSRKKPRVYVEKVKRQHTTHWDMDYLTNAEVDALYGLGSENPSDRPQAPSKPVRPVKWYLIIGGAVAIILALAMIVWHLIST